MLRTHVLLYLLLCIVTSIGCGGSGALSADGGGDAGSETASRDGAGDLARPDSTEHETSGDGNGANDSFAVTDSDLISGDGSDSDVRQDGAPDQVLDGGATDAQSGDAGMDSDGGADEDQQAPPDALDAGCSQDGQPVDLDQIEDSDQQPDDSWGDSLADAIADSEADTSPDQWEDSTTDANVEPDPCSDLELWLQIYGGTPTCPGYTISANWDANYCEFYLNALGDGYEGHYGIPFSWLEAYVSVKAVDGIVLNVGMYTEYEDTADGTEHHRFSLGSEVEPDYWKTGFTYQFTGYMGGGSYYYNVVEFAFFIDVQRSNGQIDRLWQSNAGQNYSWGDAFTLPTSEKSIPYGHVDYSNDASPIFAPKLACQ